MALVATALSFVQDYVPYERPPQDVTLWSAIPRGLLTGIVNAGVLDAKPVNDTQTLTCTMTLPPNYGYVMAEAQFEVIQNRAQDWNPAMYFEFTNFIRGAFGNVQGLTAQYPQSLLDTRVNGAAVAMSVVQPWPAMPMIGASSSAPIIIVIHANNSQATVSTAGTVMAFASFWQFDLEQIRKYPINSPQPVHAR